MNKSFDGIVDEIRLIRWSLIPPYCENLDEDEKSSDAYEEYFAVNLGRCIESSRRYLASIEALALSADDERLADVFSARSEFADSFPFCYDELVNVGADELKPYHDFMGATYRGDAMSGGLRNSIAEYVELLEKIRAI